MNAVAARSPAALLLLALPVLARIVIVENGRRDRQKVSDWLRSLVQHAREHRRGVQDDTGPGRGGRRPGLRQQRRTVGAPSRGPAP